MGGDEIRAEFSSHPRLSIRRETRSDACIRRHVNSMRSGWWEIENK